MQPLIFHKDKFGLPTTQLSADLSDRTPQIDFTWSALWGPLEASISWPGTLNEGFEAANRWLGCPIEIWSPNGEWLWEGIIWTVSFGAGQRRRKRSLDGYAERGYVFYNALSPFTHAPITGPPWKIVIGPNTSTGTRPHFVLNIGGPWLEASANARAELELSRRNRLLWLPETGGALPSGDFGTADIQLECLGWYRTLWYNPHVRYTNEFWSIAEIIKQILLVSCPFVSSDQSDINVINVSGASYNYFDKYEMPGELIKRLLPITNGLDITTDEFIFSLQRGRKPYLQRSRRLNTSPDYIEHIDGTIESSAGGKLEPYLIRPDMILRQTDFAPSSVPSGMAVDSIESMYLTETNYSSSDHRVGYRASVAGVLGEVEAL